MISKCIFLLPQVVSMTGPGHQTPGGLPGVRHQTQQSSLGNPAAAGACLKLVTVLDQLHDHQSVYLDNLDRHHTLEILNGEFITHLNTGVILSVLTGVTTRVGHLQLSGFSSDTLFVTLRVATQDNL